MQSCRNLNCVVNYAIFPQIQIPRFSEWKTKKSLIATLVEAILHKGEINQNMLRKTKLFNMNVTNAAILQYYNISNPGLLEQEPGQEQGLTVLLYEYFYAG